MESNVVRSESGLFYMWKLIGWDLDTCQCVCPRVRTNQQQRTENNNSTRIILYKPLKMLRKATASVMILFLSSARSFPSPSLQPILRLSVYVDRFKCKQSWSRCKCRYQTWFTLKSRWKWTDMKMGQCQQTGTGHQDLECKYQQQSTVVDSSFQSHPKENPEQVETGWCF